MGLKRFSGEFSYRKNGQTKNVTVISPVVEEYSTVNIIQSIIWYPYNERHGGGQWTNSPTFSRYAIPYYWSDDNDFDLSAKMIEGTSFSTFTDLVEAFTTLALSEFETMAAFDKTLDSRDYPQFCSQEQGCFGTRNSSAFTMPYITIRVAGSAISAQLTRTGSVWFEFLLGSAGVFDEETGKWPKTGGWRLNIQWTSNTPYNSSEIETTKICFINDSIKVKTMPGVAPGITAGGTQFYYGNPGNAVWPWFRVDENDVIMDCVGLLGVLSYYPYAMQGVTCPWNSSGELEPTDPWDTPEPYPPTPPIPPTPDPPVPVDPVDPIPEPDDPPIGGADVGFMSIYSPDRSTLKHIAEQFWNPTALQAIKQYFTDPIDAVIGLSVVPVRPETRSAEAVVIGMYNTHVGAPVVTTEYTTHNCGSVYIPKFFNSYLDYDPYTKYQLYLPFIGEVELNADEITSKTITIKYKCNVVTGDCVALVMIGNNVFGTFNGNFSRQVPITAANYGAIISSAVNIATTAATVGVGVVGSQLTGEAIAENAVKASTSELTSSGAIRATGAEVAAMNTAASGTASLVNNVMSAKATYTKSGNVGQGAGQISVRTPYLTITRPNLTLPENTDQASQSSLRRYVGYASNKIGRLSSFHGLTVVEACRLSSQHATDGEIAEALEIMRGGVIL